MARRHHYSSNESSEEEDGEFIQKSRKESDDSTENSSKSDSGRETRDRRRGGRRRHESLQRREERADSEDSEKKEVNRSVERERKRRKDDDGRRDKAGRRGDMEKDSRSSDEEEVGRGRRGSSVKEKIDTDKEDDDGPDKQRSRKREEASRGNKERDYERRRKNERESRYDSKEHENRRREDNGRGSRRRHRDSESDEDDKKFGRKEESKGHGNGYRRSEGDDQRYKERWRDTEKERVHEDEKDDRKDMRRRLSGHEENDVKGHRGRETEGRYAGREDDKEADYRKERHKEWDRDRDRERRRKHLGKDRRRKDGAEDMGWNEDKVDERSAKEKGDDGKVTDDLKVPKVENLGRSGGVYIPPFKLARMMKEVQDKSSVEYQRMTWDALRKSINGLVNKVNATNIKNIIPELFAENLIRGRGLFCRSCMKSQMASPAFTDVFAALVAVVNTKFPEVGELLLRRIILQLQRAYKRNDKPQLLAAVKFIAHLVNQQVVHELIALELLTILLENPTDDSVEVAVGFVTECGSILQDLCPRGLHGIFERFRGILHEGEIDKRVQFLIEGLFALRKAKFQGYPAVRAELDLVEQEDQLTHEISLSDQIDPEIALDIFKQDPNFLENEKKYEELKKSILGEESEDEEADSDEGSEDEDEEESDDEEHEEQMKIKDETETNLINLRRTIYLTIMSSVDFEEAGHKLLKIKLEPGQEMELCIMLLECCSQERTYLRYYGLLGQRFCMINKVYQENFDKCFVQQYSMIHRLETNKLRNVAKFFAHLLGTDALPWHVLAYIRLTEEDTTSSSRIFIKILFQELSEHLGIRLLNERLNDPTMEESFESIFPKDNPKNTRFAINFFTSIGLGGITESLREYLKNMPRLIMQQQKPVSESEEESGSSISSGSDSSGSESESSSSEESESDDRRRKRGRRN